MTFLFTCCIWPERGLFWNTYFAVARRKSSKLTMTVNAYGERIVCRTGVGMAVDWATLGGVIPIGFYTTGGTVLVKVCRAAARRSWLPCTELDMYDVTNPTNFLLPLFADEQTDTLNHFPSVVCQRLRLFLDVWETKSALSLWTFHSPYLWNGHSRICSPPQSWVEWINEAGGWNSWEFWGEENYLSLSWSCSRKWFC